MLYAVVHGKAKADKIIDGVVKQPREDLVTSSIIGSIRLLSHAAQSKALSILAGREIGNLFDLYLWPRFRGEGRGWVEPDVVVKFEDVDGPAYWIIEVKWGADLGVGQANRELHALRMAACSRNTVSEPPRRVCGYTLLGFEPKHCNSMNEFEEKNCGELSIVRQEWSDITRKLKNLLKKRDASYDLIAWASIVYDFLQKVPQGQTLTDWQISKMPPAAEFSFEVLRFFEELDIISPVAESEFEFGE